LAEEEDTDRPMLLPTGDDDNTPAGAEGTLMNSHKAQIYVAT